MSIFGFAASLRKESVNQKLLLLSQRLLKDAGINIDLTMFNHYDAPLYNYDIEANSGIPKGIQHFAHDIKSHQGMIIASPEYNFSTPGTLKNLIDWASRIQPNPFFRQPILLISASPAVAGGQRGLLHTRIPLETYLGAHVFPDMFCLGNAYAAFDEKGDLLDEKLQERLRHNLIDFVEFTKKIL